jgi:synaptobrevin family protein YKT6
VVLAKALDVSRFGFFRRFAARKFIVSVALSTAAGRRQTVQHKGTPILLSTLDRPILLLCRSRVLNPIWSDAEYKVHCYNPNGLCAVVHRRPLPQQERPLHPHQGTTRLSRALLG